MSMSSGPQLFTPPIGSRTVTSVRPTSHVLQATARPSVLCVDDELPVLDGIARVLSSRFNVTTTSKTAVIFRPSLTFGFFSFRTLMPGGGLSFVYRVLTAPSFCLLP